MGQVELCLFGDEPYHPRRETSWEDGVERRLILSPRGGEKQAPETF